MTQMNWLVAYPEILLLVAACVVALVDLAVTDPKRGVTYWLTQISLGAVAVMHGLALQTGLGAEGAAASVYGMQGLVVSDPMGHLLALSAALAMMLTMAYSRHYVADRDLLKGEFFTLAMFVLLGISVMISANNFLVIYVGLELMSLSLYALAALRRDHAVATEAAMKYFVLGALASGFLLYGMSMLYGATKSLVLSEVLNAIHTGQINATVLTFGVVFIVAGLGFKLGVVPFHMWVPDVYQGSPTAVTLMISGAPKLAAFAIAIRLLVEGLLGLGNDWQEMLIVLSVLSMIIGNFAAIAQTNLKRMLAYSSVAHAGYLMTALVAAPGLGTEAILFYLVTYAAVNLGGFGAFAALTRGGREPVTLADMAGLSERRPLLAAALTVFLVSLTGVPVSGGFVGKFYLFSAAVSAGYVHLAIIGMIMSVVSAYYYLRVVVAMYMDGPVGEDSWSPVGVSAALALAISTTVVLVLGVYPGPLMALARMAAASLLR